MKVSHWSHRSNWSNCIVTIGVVAYVSSGFSKWNNAFEGDIWAIGEQVKTDSTGNSYYQTNVAGKAEMRSRFRDGPFTFSVDPQIRALALRQNFNNEVQKTLYTPTIEAPQRGLELESELWGNDNFEYQGSLERLTLGIKKNESSISIGRQAFSLGSMKLVPIWNRFVSNLPLPDQIFQFPTQDGIALRFQSNIWTLNYYSIFKRQSELNAHLAEQIYNIDGYELKFLAGSWEENVTYGVGFSIPFFEATLRGEFLDVGISFNDDVDVKQFGFGYETAFNSSTSINFETLHLSDGKRDKSEYSRHDLNTFRPLYGADYFVLQFKIEASSYLSIETPVLVNYHDHSTILGVDGVYSLSDNSELALRMRLPTGGRETEFATASTTQHISLRFKYFF